MGRLFGLMNEKEEKDGNVMQNRALLISRYTFHSGSNVRKAIELISMRWARSVACMREMNSYKILGRDTSRE
jgi:hypothetical protein